MGVRTLGVEGDLLAVLPRPLTVHIAVPHFTFNLVERFAVVGQYTEERRTAGTGSAEDEELIRLCVNMQNEWFALVRSPFHQV